MNATEVTSELSKHGGVADKEWHGDEIQMKTSEEHQKELKVNEYEQDAAKFEIEVENSPGKQRASFKSNDALQRQQTTPTSTI